MGLLNGLKRKWPTYIFRNAKVDLYKASKRYRTEFMLQRRYAAAKLNQPRLNLISFKSLRHHYACRLYEKTKDILFVQRQVGHRSLSNTIRYTRMVNFGSDDDYVCKVAKAVKEASELVEAGFDYVCDVEGYKLFRKRK